MVVGIFGCRDAGRLRIRAVSLWEVLKGTIRNLSGNVVREFRSGGGATAGVYLDHVYRGDQILATEVRNTNGTYSTRHMTLDHLGSPRLVTDDFKNRLAEHEYYPYGEEATTAANPVNLRFTAHERDYFANGGATPAQDDLDYMHARFFNPVPGRFTSFDPIGGNPRAPQSWNRYAYVLGNPVKFTDPWGLAASCGTNGSSDSVDCADGIIVTPDGGSSDAEFDWRAWGNFLAQAQAHRGRFEYSRSPVASRDFALAVLSSVAADTKPVADFAVGIATLATDLYTFGGVSAIQDLAAGDGQALGAQVLLAISPLPFDGALARAASKYPGKVGRIELHHVWPKYLGGPRNGVKVALPAEYHQVITNEFRALHAYGAGPIPRETAFEIMRQVYKHNPIKGFPVK